jgi:hypothetical protein
MAPATAPKTLMGYRLADLRKALTGGVVAAGSAFGVAISDLVITRAEVGTIVGAFVVGAIGVFIVPNSTKVPKAKP